MSRRDILGTTFATPDPVVAAVAHRHRVELGLAGCPDEFTDWEPSWPLAHPAEPTPIFDQLAREKGAPL